MTSVVYAPHLPYQSGGPDRTTLSAKLPLALERFSSSDKPLLRLLNC